MSVPEGLASLSPYRVLNDSLKAVPAMKYALGVAGVIAVVAIVGVFRLSYRVAFVGALVMFAFMVLLVVFAKLARTAPRHFAAPVIFLMWSFLLLAICTACLLFTSVFFRTPIDLQEWIKPAAAARIADGVSLSTILASGVPPLPAQQQVPLELGFEVLARKAVSKVFTPLEEGGILASDIDDYCIVVRVPGSGYLYVFQADAAGRIQWLFPANDTTRYSSGTNPVPAQATLTIPSDTGVALYLDSTTGKENIYAVFSAARWPDLESALRNEARNQTPSGAGAAGRDLLAADGGVGGIRNAPRLTSDAASASAKVLNGVTYRLPAPAKLIQASGDFLVIKHWFQHVASH